MRCLTLRTSGVSEGIEVQLEPWAHLQLGEPGAQTRSTWFPLAKGFARTYFGSRPGPGPHILGAAYYIRSRSKGTLLLVEEHAESPQAIVKLAVAPGRGGAVRYTGATFASAPCPLRGQRLYPQDLAPAFSGEAEERVEVCRRCGDPARFVGAWEGWLHGDSGEIPDYDPLPVRRGTASFDDPQGRGGLRILAEGTQPIEGGAGTYSELLVVLEPDVSFRVERYGEARKGDPREMLCRWNGRELTVES